MVRTGRRGPGGSRQAGERRAAVEGDHVGQRGRDVDGGAARGAVELGVGAVQVADYPLGVGPGREPAKVGLLRGVQRSKAAAVRRAARSVRT